MEVKDASNECSTAGVNECTPYASYGQNEIGCTLRGDIAGQMRIAIASEYPSRGVIAK